MTLALTLDVEDKLEDVLCVVSKRLMVDTEWIVNGDHARRPQAAFARKMFVFAAHHPLYGDVSQRLIASYLEVDQKTVHRLFWGYFDADGVRQPGGFDLVRGEVAAQQLAVQIREDLHP